MCYSGTNKFGRLKTGVPDISADKNFLDSKHVLKVYFKPSRKDKDFVFITVPILPVWVKIGYFRKKLYTALFMENKLFAAVYFLEGYLTHF